MPQRVVHIVDDDPDILQSVSFMLRADGMTTTTHASAEAFLAALPDLSQGCVLIDIRMPGMDGLQLQQHLHAQGCHMPVVIVTGHGDVDSAVAAMKEGAVDFIQKPFAKPDLIAAIEAAWQRLNSNQPAPEDMREAREAIKALTRRERQVLAGLVRGQANKVIAYELDISPRTVELYRANAMRKLGARSLSDMLHTAFLAGFDGTDEDGEEA